MAEPIPMDVVSQILSSKPYITIDGTFNFRDLSSSSEFNLKPGYVFRSGSLESLSATGQKALVKLGVKTVFDMRSEAEAISCPDPVVDGVDIVHVPTDTNYWKLDKELAGKEQNPQGLLDLASMYFIMLEANKPIWKKILEHVRDSPERSFVVHCTAGKDRTGVAAALVLGLAGLPAEYIARDYALTRVGIEPVRELLTKKLTGGKAIDLSSSPMMRMMSTAQASTMIEFLQKIDEKYGSVPNFVQKELEFSLEDIDKMRENLKGSTG